VENNNDSIELQSNYKRASVKVDLAGLPLNPCLIKKFMITILVVVIVHNNDK
jgi:hypothetical protein